MFFVMDYDITVNRIVQFIDATENTSIHGPALQL